MAGRKQLPTSHYPYSEEMMRLCDEGGHRGDRRDNGGRSICSSAAERTSMERESARLTQTRRADAGHHKEVIVI